MIVAKIDVTKIDKSIFFKGDKGIYMDIILFETPDGKFENDYRVVQGCSQEQKANGWKGEILGNAKCYGQAAKINTGQQEPTSTGQDQGQAPDELASDDIPF